MQVRLFLIPRHHQTVKTYVADSPSPELVKINFDGTVFPKENKSGIRVVIRNNKGSVITSCSKKFPHAYSGSDIEAMTAAMTLPFALDIGITHAVLEGDSWAVIRALMEDDCSLAPFGLLVEDAKVLSRSIALLLY